MAAEFPHLNIILTDAPIHPPEARARLSVDPSCGGLVSFEGMVRDHNLGKSVRKIEYHAYESLARKEIERISKEAHARFPFTSATIIHRTGSLNIGDTAVLLMVSSPHRQEAFSACWYMIDEIKVRVPIWKKEFYGDGTVSWPRCARCEDHEHHRPVRQAPHLSPPVPH